MEGEHDRAYHDGDAANLTQGVLQARFQDLSIPVDIVANPIAR
jgi:hypothetical protein